MHGDDAPIRPVADEQRALHCRREIAARAKLNSRRRREADVQRGRAAVGKILGPLARAATPAVVRAAHDVIHAARAIPRRPCVPLHVGVEREHLAVLVPRDVERVAQSAREQRPLFPVGIGAENVAGGQLHVAVEHLRIPRARDEPVVAKIPQRRVGRGVRSHRDVVPVHDVDHAIRPELDVIAPVADAALGAEQFLDRESPGHGWDERGNHGFHG